MESVQLELELYDKPIDRMEDELIDEERKEIKIYKTYDADIAIIYYCYVLTEKRILDVSVSKIKHWNQVFAIYDVHKKSKTLLKKIFKTVR